ncbi:MULTISPECIES: hypothetical protein [unclassified Acinetobacter]|uniref:hypothetical protein n=1 Tax=unclassified Acinetobacter TaxID=196816 RepID=UPI0035B97C2A
MIINLPPHIEQLVVRQAELQGVSVQQATTQILEQHFQKERAFNFDLDEIKQAVESGFVEMPVSAKKDFASFDAWLKDNFA